ncbi:MAG: efflux RND transporter periplasmic adaptor subunit [Flavobacteriales bacterium]|nr:efflux RND transporter periplasmic adaptor subunit [Flavobacteriales bacterium]
MKTRHVVLVGAIVMVLFMVKTLISNQNIFSLKTEEKKGSSARFVKAIEASPDSNMVLIEGQGRISSTRKIDVSAEVQGLILPGKVFKSGTNVRQGELLFSIRDQDARLSLQARKSNYLNVISNVLPDLKLDYPESYNEWKNFFDKIEISSPLPELPVVKSSREKSFLASKNIFGEYYGIRSDEERLKKYVVVAPFDGTITDVFSEPGAVVNPGTKLLSLIKSDDLEIEVPIDVKNIGWIKVGAKVELHATSGPAEFTGTVIRIGEFVNASTQSMPVFVKIEKGDKDVLYSGMYLTAKIRGHALANTIEIPRRAIVDDHYYYFIKDSLLVKKELNIEYVTKENVIASGIPKGTMVVIEPLSNVNDSLRVIPNVKK